MSQLNQLKKASDADMVYYDIVASNFQSTTTEPPALRFSESRTNPIISNTGDYYMSIVRFSLDTYDLPNFICEIQPNQADPNLSIYSTTLEYDDGAGTITSSAQTFINWQPQNVNTPVPLPPSQTATGLQPTNTNYYYCYQFQYFLALINQAWQTAMADLITATGGGASPITTANQPSIVWDNNTQKAIINAEEQYYKNSLPAKIRIYMNPPLFALFNSFASINYGVNATLGRNYQIAIEDFVGLSLIQLPVNAPTYTAIQVFQEFSTIDTWTPVSSIVFTSNTLPIVSNQLSAPLIFNDGAIIVGSGNNSNFAQIITDMETNQQVYKPQILYSPTAEYRRIDMTGNRGLVNMDIEVYWRDKLGGLNQFYLPSGGSSTIKFLFERKDKYNLKGVDPI
jgi:hypothetical protein